MNNAERITHYTAQTGSDVLTPAQRRRIAKHAHRSMREYNFARISRLRKAWERKRRREIRDTGNVLIATIRASQSGGRRSTARGMFRQLLG